MKKHSIHMVANNKNKTKQQPQTTLNEPHPHCIVLTSEERIKTSMLSHTSSNNAIASTHIRQNKRNITVKELFSQTCDNSIIFDRKQHESGSIAIEDNTIATRQI